LHRSHIATSHRNHDETGNDEKQVHSDIAILDERYRSTCIFGLKLIEMLQHNEIRCDGAKNLQRQ
jgi:hypothetical protein